MRNFFGSQRLLESEIQCLRTKIEKSYGDFVYSSNHSAFGLNIQLKVVRDEFPSNPRHDETISSIACDHPRYNLSDVDGHDSIIEMIDSELEIQFTKQFPQLSSEGYTYLDDMLPCPNCIDCKGTCDQCIEGQINNPFYSDDTDLQSRLSLITRQCGGMASTFVFQPVYLYDHSGISISTAPFSCQWDSSLIGFIAISLKSAQELGLIEQLDLVGRKKLVQMMKSEIDTYDDYLCGNCYGYELEVNGHDYSCFGYLGDSGLKQIAESASSTILDLSHETKKEFFKKLKALIVNRVPLSTRDAILSHNFSQLV